MTKKLDILFLSDNSLSVVGGGEESLRIIINGIKNDYNVALIEPGVGCHENPECSIYELSKYKRIKHIAKNPLLLFKYLIDVRGIINRTNPTIIHTQSQVSFFIVGFLKRIKFISRDILLVHTERGLYTKYGRLIRAVFLYCMRYMDILVTTTEFNKAYWEDAINKRYKNPLNNYSVIENTAGKIFEDLDESRLKESVHNLTIGFAGRYCDWKNWPLAVEISERLNEGIGNNLYVKMAVGCLDEKALDETKSMFKKLEGIFGNRFEGEINISIEEMDKFYYEIDVFVLTSMYNTESFGRTLVEAMSRKTVVLTTDAGGSVEVVGNPNNVHKTSDEFVDKIMELFNDKEKMVREKEKNLRRVKDVYSLGNNINKHLSMYSSILNRL